MKDTTGIALISFGLGITALIAAIAALTKPVARIYIPTVEEIESSNTFGRLQGYYNLIGDLYLKGAIDEEKYHELYSSYEQRYYELLEA